MGVADFDPLSHLRWLSNCSEDRMGCLGVIAGGARFVSGDRPQY